MRPLCIVLAGLGLACSSERIVAVYLPDSAAGDVSEPDVPPQGDIAVDTPPPPPEDAAEDTTKPDAGPFKPFWKPDNVALGEEFVLRGVWGAGPEELIAVGTKATILEYHGAKWEVAHQNLALDTLNGVWGASMSDVWAVGEYGAILHRSSGGWNIGTGCVNDANCDDGDPCHQGKCGLDGNCQYLPTGNAGCCGTPSYQTGWDDGTLSGWTVLDTSADKLGMMWNVTSHVDGVSGQSRWTSPTYALYFGDPDKPCMNDPSAICPNFENGSVVASTATSPSISLPQAGTVEATFQVFIDSESSDSYDKLELQVIQGASTTTVWQKSDVGGTTDGVFVTATADLTTFAGATVQLRFMFDSSDSFANDGEGVYIDDFTVTSVCGGAGTKDAGFPTLWGVWGAATDDVYAVGNTGTILHWDGKSWKRQLGGAARDLFAISGNDVAIAAVGADGEGFTSFGGGFGTDPTGVNGTLRGIAVLGGQDAIAVGDNGAIVRHGASGWTPETSGTFATLQDVWSDGTTSYAVGSGGTILRNTGAGAGWLPVTSEAEVTLYDAWGPDASDLYVVGEQGLLFHHDGTSLTKVGDLIKDSGKTDLRGIYGFGKQGPIFTVGGGGYAAAQIGGTWKKTATPTTYVLHAVWGASADDVWAVGNLGVILHWTGTAWAPYADSPTKATLYDVWGRSASDVYAAGANGVLIHFDGTGWSVLRANTTSNLRAVWGRDAKDVYAVGANATIMHFNGLYWTQVKVEDDGDKPVVAELFDVWASSADDVWAVGQDGLMVHHEPNKDTGQVQWVKVPQKNTVTLRGAWGLDKDHFWVVGREGTVFLVEEAALKQQPTDTVATLFDVIGFGKDGLVSVGDLGTVLRYITEP